MADSQYNLYFDAINYYITTNLQYINYIYEKYIVYNKCFIYFSCKLINQSKILNFSI